VAWQVGSSFGSARRVFSAATGGSLSLVWTTTVPIQSGTHQKPKTVAIAKASANATTAGAINVTLHLTGDGKTLLRKEATSLVTTASEKFKPNGQAWQSMTKKFSL
jgi:hypothetical protein